jgi:hypothetical protein
MKTETEIYLSQADLAKRIGISANTLRTRCFAAGIVPDGLVVQNRRHDILLFKSERFAEIRDAVLHLNTSHQ